jgi:hypothetical protein
MAKLTTDEGCTDVSLVPVELERSPRPSCGRSTTARSRRVARTPFSGTPWPSSSSTGSTSRSGSDSVPAKASPQWQALRARLFRLGGPAVPRRASRGDGSRARRGPGNAVLARRQRAGPLAHRRLPRGRRATPAAPRWLAERSRHGQVKTKTGYEPPPWLWGFDRSEERRLRQLPSVIELRALRLPRGRGVAHAWLLPLASRTPLERLLPSVLLARFA